jgi:uncharacterized membrane protein YdbT with pleckstrin-like domain
MPIVGRKPGSSSDGEQVVMRLRPHGRALAVPLAVLLVSLAVAGFAAARMPEGTWQAAGRWAVAGLTAAVVLRGSLVPWLRWLTTAFVVTDRRVTLHQGVLRRSSREVPLSRVADVGVERTLGQRLLRSGTLVLDTVGERGGLVVRDVPGARDVADRLAELLDLPGED